MVRNSLISFLANSGDQGIELERKGRAEEAVAGEAAGVLGAERYPVAAQVGRHLAGLVAFLQLICTSEQIFWRCPK